MVPHYTIIADPNSSRWEHYHRELLEFWNELGVTPEIQLIAWSDVIPRDGNLTGLIDDKPTLLRIESPATDFDLVSQFLQAGEQSSGIETPTVWKQPREGWIASPSTFYKGLCTVLDGIGQSVESLSHVTQLADMDDIKLLFDKNATTNTLVKALLNCPETHRPPANPKALYRQFDRLEWSEAYLKLAHGSCASGIVRFLRQHRHTTTLTTVTEIDGQFHNTMRLESPQGRQLDNIVQFLINESATVQKGIRKATIANQNFDVRVVVIRDRVAATIFRVSPHPMTNLHLGGFRGDAEQIRRLIPPRKWAEGISQCIEAASQFDLPMVGVDLMFEYRSFDPYLIELNAFGDFFPNWTNENEKTIHRQEIESTAEHYGLLD